MFKTKEYIGLSYDESTLRIAKVRLNKDKKPVLIATHSIALTKPLDSTDEPDVDPLEGSKTHDLLDMDLSGESSEKISEPDDFDVLTNFSDLADHPPENDNFENQENDDPFNLETDESGKVEAEEKRPNELLLTEYFEQCSSKKLITGVHIPFGKTAFQLIKGVDPSVMKKRDRHEFFVDKLKPVHSEEIEKDQYSWVQLDPNRSILAYAQNSFELITLVESVQEYTTKKVVLQERLPDESIWAGLLRYNYDLPDHEITGLIAIGKRNSRVIFMKGAQIISILPIITEGEESSIVLNTIFSKILFELDKGDLPDLDRLLLVHSDSMGEMAKVYFQRQFENAEVDLLNLNTDKVVLTDPSRQTASHLQPYMTSIGAAFAAADIDKTNFSDFSLVPDYIKEKQQLYKIEWHGAFILILIGLTPLFLNHIYEQKSNVLNQLNQDILLTEIQIDNLKPLANLTDNIQYQTTQLNRENEFILELSQYSHEWSDVIQILNAGTSNISGLWFTSIRNNAANLTINGFSLTREALPQLAGLFTDVNIIQVNQSEIREQAVYNFSMIVHNFRQDIPSFEPELPVSDIRFRDMEVIDDEPAAVEQESIVSVPDNDIEPEGTEQSTVVDPMTPSASVHEEFGLRVTQAETITGSFAIVIHSLQNEQNALTERDRLIELGYKSVVWPVEIVNGETTTTTWRVGIGQFESVTDAMNSVTELPADLRESYFISRIL